MMRFFSKVVLAIALMLGLLAPDARGQTCQSGWLSRVSQEEFNGPVLAAVEYDADGAGPFLPQLIVGGTFTRAGGVPVNGIARWTGTAWAPLGTLPPGAFVGGVTSMAVYQEPGAPFASLFVAGSIYLEGFQSIRNFGIARWNGSTWSSVSGAPWQDADQPGFYFPASIDVLATVDVDGTGPQAPVLVAGGRFDAIGQIQGPGPFVLARSIARWNGQNWSAFGTGLAAFAPVFGGMGPPTLLSIGRVLTVAALDPDGAGPAPHRLYAGGYFGSNSSNLDAIARWNGFAWESLTGFSGTADFQPAAIRSLVPFDPDGAGPLPTRLAVGGEFVRNIGGPLSGVALFDGFTWSSLGQGLPSAAGATLNGAGFADLERLCGVGQLAVHDADGAGPEPARLWAFGRFPGGSSQNSVAAQWTGAAWDMNALRVGGRVRGALSRSDPDGAGPMTPELMLGGDFPPGLLRLNAGEIARVTDGVDGPIRAALQVDPDVTGLPDPVVVVGGTFTNAGGARASNIAAWNGQSWSSLGRLEGGGGNVTGVIRAGEPFSAPPGTVHTLRLFDADGPGPSPRRLIAGGTFATADGTPARGIAQRVDGVWQALGSGALTGDGIAVLREVDFDGPGPAPARLVAGGRFTQIGGVTTQNIAIWDGAAWSPFAAPLPVGGFSALAVTSLEEYDQDQLGPQGSSLFVGGTFPGGLRRWDGTAWQPVGGGVNGSVLAMAVYDDDLFGTRPESLYIAGPFTSAGGAAHNGVTRWDGAAFHSLAPGRSGVTSMTVLDLDGNGPLRPALVTCGQSSAGMISLWQTGAWSTVASSFGFTSGFEDAGISLSGACDLVSRVARPIVVSSFDADGAGPNPARLVVGGMFEQISGVRSPSLALWACPPSQSGTDFVLSIANPSGELEVRAGDAASVNASAAVVGVASGTAWTDAVYLSRDEEISIDDVLCGERLNTAAGATGVYAALQNFVVPFVEPGLYYALVRLDAANAVFEPEEDNNSAAVPVTVLEYPSLGTPDFSAPLTIEPGSTKVVSFEVPSSSFLRLDVIATNAAGLTVVASPRLPTPADAVSASVVSPTRQRIELDEADAGRWYLAISAPPPTQGRGADPLALTIQGTILAPEITGVSPARAPSKGTALFRLTGRAVDRVVAASLRLGGTTVEATSVDATSNTAAFTQFLLDEEPGLYDLDVRLADGTVLTVPDAVELAPRPEFRPAAIVATLQGPWAIRPNRSIQLELSFGNEGELDSPPVPLRVVGSDGSSFSIVGTGTGGRILPGEFRARNLTRRAPGGDDPVTYSVLSSNPNQIPFPWDNAKTDYLPAGMQAAEWAALVDAARPRIGETWGNVLEATAFIGGWSDSEESAAAAEFKDSFIYAVLIYSDALSPTRATRPGLSERGGSPSGPRISFQQFGDPAARDVIVINHGFGEGTSDPNSRFHRLAQQAVQAAESEGRSVRVLLGNWSGVSDQSSVKVRDVGRQARAVGEEAYTTLRDEFDVDMRNVRLIGESFGNEVNEHIAKRFASDDVYDLVSPNGGQFGVKRKVAGFVAMNPASSASGQQFEPPANVPAYAFRTDSQFDEEDTFGTGGPNGLHYDFVLETSCTGAITSQCEHTSGIGRLADRLAANPSAGLQIIFNQLPGLEQRAGANGFDGSLNLDGTFAPPGTPAFVALDDSDEGTLPVAPGETEIAQTTVNVVNSFDPNDIIGPDGFGPERWITAAAPLRYLVRFENLPAATAPAQTVLIRLPLDQNLDPGTIELDRVEIAGRSFRFASRTNVRGQVIDLTESTGLNVRVDASVDATGVLVCHLECFDPLTGLLPVDPLAGFLPPNTAPPIGEGALAFSIRPRASAATGARVEAEASIVFDENAPINTPRVFNTLDRDPPFASLRPFSRFAQASTFPVRAAEAQDTAGAGLARVELWVSVNGQPFARSSDLSMADLLGRVRDSRKPRAALALQEHAGLESLFTGSAFNTYAFAARAVDNAGNTAPITPVTPDVTVKVYDYFADGVLSPQDVFKVINDIRAGLLSADVNRDGVLSVLDVIEIRSMLQAAHGSSNR